MSAAPATDRPRGGTIRQPEGFLDRRTLIELHTRCWIQIKELTEQAQ